MTQTIEVTNEHGETIEMVQTKWTFRAMGMSCESGGGDFHPRIEFVTPFESDDPDSDFDAEISAIMWESDLSYPSAEEAERAATEHLVTALQWLLDR